jgi:aminoglycoside phosphotransferase family enzyme
MQPAVASAMQMRQTESNVGLQAQQALVAKQDEDMKDLANTITRLRDLPAEQSSLVNAVNQIRAPWVHSVTGLIKMVDGGVQQPVTADVLDELEKLTDQLHDGVRSALLSSLKGVSAATEKGSDILDEITGWFD